MPAPQPMDILILDLGLPGMDGFEVIRQLRGLGSSIPDHRSVQPHR